MDSQLDNQKSQENSQDTPGNPPAKVNEAPKGDKNAPRYTEKQYGEMRKKMQDQINVLRTDLNAARTEAEDWRDKTESLQDKVVKLQSEVDERIPEDSKEYRTKLTKREEEISKREREHNRKIRDWESKLAERNETDKQELINGILAKFDGVDIGDIHDLDSPEAINQYIGAKILEGGITPKAPEPEAQPVKDEGTKDTTEKQPEPLPATVSPSEFTKSEEQRLKEMYPTMFPQK
jgi:hypothetical protein